MSIAKAIIGTVGAALVGILAAWIALPDWLLQNLSMSPVQTVVGFFASAFFGGAVVFAAYSAYVIYSLGEKPVKAFQSLKKVKSLSGCRSLSDAAEQVEKLDSKCSEMENALSVKDAEIAALRSTKVPTPLDMLKASLGDEGIASFRALCAASTYVDGKPARSGSPHPTTGSSSARTRAPRWSTSAKASLRARAR